MKSLSLTSSPTPAFARNPEPEETCAALSFSPPHLLTSSLNTLRRLHRSSPPLAWSGWLCVALGLVALGLLPFDHRLVTGALVWLKPLKFALSIGIYAWTLAWLLADLPAPAQRAVRRIAGGVALSMVAELMVIFGQAARGTTSHYNVATPLDARLFEVMAIGILLNTVLTAWVLYLVWRYRPQGSAGYVWGVRLGVLVFLLGSVIGGFMIHNVQHTVGAPDGGPGLPGLGWSTRAGDLRIAHFLGMHALQALPLLGWAVGRWRPRQAPALVWLGAALYSAAVAALLGQALGGHPLWAGR